MPLEPLRRYFAAQDRVWKAKRKLSLQSELCPNADRCRDRTCRRRKGCRKVAAAAVALEAAQARLAALYPTARHRSSPPDALFRSRASGTAEAAGGGASAPAGALSRPARRQ